MGAHDCYVLWDGTWTSYSHATFVLAGAALLGQIFLAAGSSEPGGLAQRWMLASVLSWHLMAAWRLMRLAAEA